MIEPNDQPVWAIVVGFESLYEASSDGHVRRIGSDVCLTPQPIDGGYMHVQLWRGNRAHNRLVHVLVAAAFLGPCPPGMEVNHKDGRHKWDNSVGNLEYMTRSENMKHAYATGLRKPTVSAAAAARRKPRRVVPCGCGCGVEVETPDRKGRDRRFLPGHSLRVLS